MMIWWPKCPKTTKIERIQNKRESRFIWPLWRSKQDRQLMWLVSSRWFWVDEESVKSSPHVAKHQKGILGRSGCRDDEWEFAMHRSYICDDIYRSGYTGDTQTQTQQERVYLSTTTGWSTNTAKPGIDRWKWLGQAAIWMARGGKGYYK